MNPLALFSAVTVEQVKEILKKHLEGYKPEIEEANLLQAYNRVLAEDIVSPEDIPAFNRSTVDGFAVRARDTFGASESMPALLTLVGEIRMGEQTEIKLSTGEAAKIPTGGMLPECSDAVVMLEYTQLMDDTILCAEKPVAPKENVVEKGEDIKKGSVVLKKGHTLRPQDLGALAAVGIDRIKLVKPPAVSVISTGDEIKPPASSVKPGEVRDINTYAICGEVMKWGGLPLPQGIVRDNFEDLYDAVKAALEKSHMVLLSGGSSVGARDHTVKVIESLGKPGVLAHGLPVKPGKPTVVAVVDGKPIIGLPGHPVSAMVIFEILVRPIISTMLGRPEDFGGTRVYARMSRNIASAAGRQDFIRVKLEQRGEELWAVPVLGKSGLISNMVESHGLARIPSEKQGVAEGELVEVEIY
ncbi:molybdopterin molybdenumtransferase MoeA [Biomaibacter acetigenes]|uniref:Molybdopterin molybdenumtransferase n=1 Tax=Biomaibacter acetigenes TaxID=2316383 RepID=A0A3G2R816_9FIRM|nr:molybdopterin molybdenumtransferase MoeA [Biomaibacter acetigenes]